MHVFIDTNVYLSFYHFTNDDLESLKKIFGSHQGSAVVHVTDQVRDEFKRNREAKIADALKRFRDGAPSIQMPSFMKEYGEYAKVEKAWTTFSEHHSALLTKANKDIADETLEADLLIDEIFSGTDILKTTPAVYAKARMRVDVGNPPGKNGSIGDAVNWVLLLKHVPKGKDLFIVTDDSDFYGLLDKQAINSFLAKEWHERKASEVKCYKTLTGFLKDHYATVELSFDPQKKALIEALEDSGSFAATHAIVAKLSEFSYFSLVEAKAILEAAHANSQFGWIVRDEDVKELLLRATAPHTKSLTEAHYQNILGQLASDDT